MNKKREVEIKAKLDGFVQLLEDRLEKTKIASRSAKKIRSEINKLSKSRTKSH